MASMASMPHQARFESQPYPEPLQPTHLGNFGHGPTQKSPLQSMLWYWKWQFLWVLDPCPLVHMTWRTDRVCLTAPVSEQLSCAGVGGGEKGFGLHPGNSTFECSQQGKLTGSFFANTGHERMHECTDLLKVSRSMFCVERDIWSRVPCSHTPPPMGWGGYDAPVVVYIHTYIPTYLHTYLPTYLRTYIHTITLPYITLPYLTLPYLTFHTFHTYIQTHTQTYIHTYVRTYIHTYVRTYIHTYITLHTYIPAYIRTYQHTNIPTYHHHRPQGGDQKNHTTTTGHRGGDQKNHTTTTGHRGGGPEEPDDTVHPYPLVGGGGGVANAAPYMDSFHDRFTKCY